MFEKDTMGYDRAITVFNPEGRLFQVEYAIEAVKHGTPAVGIKAKDGVVIVVQKKSATNLMDPVSAKKLFIVDDHIITALSGLHADGRILLEHAQVQAQIEKLTYADPILIETLTKKISDTKQLYTQRSGIRPFGVALLIAGVDAKGPQLYTTDPSGTYYGWQATSIGSDAAIKPYLTKRYKPGMNLDSAVLLGVKSIAKAVETISSDMIQIGTVDARTQKAHILSNEETDKYLVEKKE
ncbi:MAG: archaeal proteasome endopeptidase complex subunit alpha [Promethearchaeota archaeon]